MKTIKLVGLVLILLVIQLPFSIAAATGSILDYRVSGQDNVQHTAREQDALSISATVAINGDTTITPDQLIFRYDQDYTFDACSPSGPSWVCSLRFPSVGQTSFPERSGFSIRLHDDTHGPTYTSLSKVDQVSGVLIVDDSSPRITAVLDKEETRNTATLSITAYDDGFKEGETNSCAGLETLDVFSDDGLIQTSFSYDENTCFARETFTIDGTNLPEKTYTLNVVATDYLSQTDSTTLTLTVDKTAGRFENLLLLDERNHELTHVGKNIVRTRVSVEVTNDVILNSIRADLSELNDIEDYSNLQGQCIPQGSTIFCEWDIDVTPNVFGSRTLSFSAEDELGNTNEVTLQVLLGRDIDGPKALQLSTQASGTNGIDYVTTSGNEIIITFAEGGIGLDERDILLDLSSLGLGTSVPASFCEPSWRCVWEDLSFNKPDGVYAVSLQDASSDILGNALQSPFEAAVVMDTSAPQKVDVIINPIGGETFIEGFVTKGDSLEVVARLVEPGRIVDAVGDFSAFITDAGFVSSDQCEVLEDGITQCTWVVGPIDKDGFIQDIISLSFVDFLGNTITFEEPLTVYAVDDSESDFFTHSVDCSPKIIDKQVAKLIDQRIVCHVALQGDAETLQLNLGTCQGENIEFLRNAELFNAQSGSKDPYLKLTLNEANIKERRLTYTCPLIITSKSGNTISSIPEREEVAINLRLEESSLGSFDENIQDKIDAAKESATGGLFSLISTLRELIAYAEKICSLITTVNNVATLFNIIGEWERIWGQTLLSNPLTAAQGAALEAEGQSQQTIAQQLNDQTKDYWIGDPSESGFLQGGLNKFCKFISCTIFFDDFGIEEEGGDFSTFQRDSLEFFNNVATGGEFGESLGLGGQGVNAYTTSGDNQRGGTDVGPLSVLQGGKLNPKDSLIVSIASLCVPGIVHNIDKYRQIQCLYADCLQTSADAGIPIHACEDAKSQATCKYVFGELFQVLPFTGLLNYFSQIVKGALSNPLVLVDVGVDLFAGGTCQTTISTPGAQTIAKVCLIREVAGLISDVYNDLSNIQDGWGIQEDYCSRIE